MSEVAGVEHRPAAELPYPVARIAIERTVRLVTTARLRNPVLLKLVGKGFFDDLAEIEGATSGRLTAKNLAPKPSMLVNLSLEQRMLHLSTQHSLTGVRMN